MNAQHTATPWIQIEGDRFSKEVVITTEERVKNSIGPICEMDVLYTGPMGIEQPANAAFIVRACNAHDDLVKALKIAEQFMEIASDWSIDEAEINGEMRSTYDWLAKVRAALAKAGA